MQPTRIGLRASRAVRVQTPALRRNARRFADAPRPQEQRPGAPETGSSTSSGSSSAGSGHVFAGVAGGAAASIVVFLTWYQLSGIRPAVKTVKQIKGYADSTAEQLKGTFKENTPEPSEAIETLKQTANKYASFIPGGRGYVDKVFKDVELVRNKHADEVDNIVRDAYGELRDTAKNGLNLETASKMWDVLTTYLSKLGSLAVDAGQDILNNHPQLKDKLGGSFDQLKQFGDNLGPEAKKQVDETYEEIRQVVNKGIQWDTVEKIRKLVEEKTQALKKLADQAWDQGYQQIKPKLDENPQVKKLVEENADALKNGNITEALDKVKDAVTTGDTGSLDQYIQQAKQKAQSFSSSSISGWLSVIPGGSAILPQLQKLREVAESRGEEAEKLAKDIMGDVKQVFDKRSPQIEELYEKGKKDVKDS